LACLDIVRASTHDIPFIMASERTPAYRGLVGSWERTQHEEALADSRYAYFLGRRAQKAVGFVIVRDWASKDRVTYIKRIIVSEAGQGTGRELLAKVVDIIFAETNAWRVWLETLAHNTRAQHVYEKLGFRREGVSRGAALLDGQHLDEVMMAVLRPEWRAER
jgi:RimJ/RimL family protein N-acetyltransferase